MWSEEEYLNEEYLVALKKGGEPKMIKALLIGEWDAPPKRCTCGYIHPKKEIWKHKRNEGEFHEGFKSIQWPICKQCRAVLGGAVPVLTSWDKELPVPESERHWFRGLEHFAR
jgi:hypothetical protein